MNKNWSGLVIDSSKGGIDYVRHDLLYWWYDLRAECAFVTRDNVNELLLRNGIRGDIGLFSLDIDGNDYWVWDALSCVSPEIVVCEYNSLFGPRRQVTIPYQEDFVREKAHYSHLYFGASIAALHALAERKGYSLVGSNTAGCNLFFVRNDLVGSLRTYSPPEAYVKAKFRESRNEQGVGDFLTFEERLRAIGSMSLWDLETEQIVPVEGLANGEPCAAGSEPLASLPRR
jgi:hypothetical protein